jgi:hypothetical protein
MILFGFSVKRECCVTEATAKVAGIVYRKDVFMRRSCHLFGNVMVAVALVGFVGCGGQAPAKKPADKAAGAHQEGDGHDHGKDKGHSDHDGHDHSKEPHKDK